MAEIINNSASTTYTDGSSTPVTITSNNLPLNLENSGGISLVKTATPSVFSAGEIIAYSIRITNTGSNFFTGVRIIDNLGGGNLAFVLGSASLTTSSQTYPVNPVSTNPLTFTLQELNVGQTITLNYRSQVIFNLPSSVSSITNTVQGIGYTASGTETGFANETIQKKTNSGVSITKSSNVTTVVPNESFMYYITLSNPDQTAKTISNITDNLPSNYNLSSVRLQIGSGTSNLLNPSDYTLSGGNVLVVPSSTGPAITIPANSSTVLTLTGFFN